jgi:tripartite-type tricarboxylate transporter receptor subunit TctC
MVGLRVLLAIAALAVAQSAWCQAWPTKPVRIFVAQGAGGGQDTITRYLADRLGTALGQQIIIENRPGAAGIIGTQAAARAVPDGYTFLVGSSAALASNPFTVKSLPYDPVKDFVPLALLTRPGFLIVANAKRPINTLADIVAIGRKEPGKLSVVIDGARNATGLVAAYLKKVTGADFTLVPYTSMMQGLQDTVAGTTDLFIQASGISMPYIVSGALRPIAVTSPNREPTLPDTPTVAETYPGFSLVGWLIIAAPAGTPTDALERMNRELDRILKDPTVAEWMRNNGSPNIGGAGSLAELSQFLPTELAVWQKVVRTIGIEPE